MNRVDRFVRRGACAGAIAVLSLSVAVASSGSAALADAAMQKNWPLVRTLLTQATDVNAAQGDGMTALHWAAAHGEADLARTLIARGASVNAVTRISRQTPLFMASLYGHAAVIDALLKAGSDPKAVSKTGSTPLMLAAASGNVDAVKLLLDAGSHANAKETGNGQTALMFASGYNRVPVIELLSARGADPNATSKVEDLFALSSDPGEGGGPARPGQVPGVDRPYRYNELVGYVGGLAPLHFAARQGHVDAVDALLKAGANLNQVSAGDHTSPLLIAIINGHFDLAMHLLDKGADPALAAENGATALFAAINCQWAPKAFYPQPRAYLQQKTGYLELMTALLAKGADPNARVKKKIWYAEYNHDESNMDESGATPFWRAAFAGDVEAMRLLIARGADPSIATVAPAQRRGSFNVAAGKDLSGLPPPVPGGPSVTPLLAAAGVGHGRGAGPTHTHHLSGWMPAVKCLVEELGADVNARDDGGDTALHYAAARGDNEMILYLVSKGAGVKAVNRSGQTVADMANGPTERGVPPFRETLALLEKLGVKPNNKCVLCS